MAVWNIPVELLVTDCVRGIRALHMDTDLGSPSVRRRVIAMLRDIVTPFLKESFKGKVDRRLAGAIFAVEQQILTSGKVEVEKLVKGPEFL